jgi:hypothetical protein
VMSALGFVIFWYGLAFAGWLRDQRH